MEKFFHLALSYFLKLPSFNSGGPISTLMLSNIGSGHYFARRPLWNSLAVLEWVWTSMLLRGKWTLSKVLPLGQY